MDLGLGIRVVRFPGEQCGPIMGVSVRTHHIKGVDVAEIGEVAKIGDCKPVAGATSRLLDRYQPR
jgi:hypothetical protein